MERDGGDRATLTLEDVEAAVRSVPFWWHSIDLGGGLVTPGARSQEFLKARMRSLHLPDVQGKTVLDIEPLTVAPFQAVSTRLKSTARYLVAETGLALPARRRNTNRYRAILHAWK